VTHLRALALAALASGLLAPPARAVTIALDPGTTVASIGDAFVLDVVVSGLAGEIVSAYDLDLVYDASVLSATSVSFADALGGASEAFLDASTALPGVVDLAGVSLLSDAELLARQGGDRLTLASLGFTRIGAADTQIAFSFDATNDVKGAHARILALTAVPGSVVSDAAAVPEPDAALLFALGFLATRLALRVRARATSRLPARP
jgi:hypothetical protein